MSSRSSSISRSFWSALGGDPTELERLRFVGEGELPSCFPVTDFASASIAVAALSIGELAADTDDAAYQYRRAMEATFAAGAD